MGIFLISVVGLYLELLLIRWIATEIRVFAYLQNTVLVVCFLGLGMGCFTSRQPVQLHRALGCLLLLTLLMTIPFTRRLLAGISSMLSVMSDFVIWSPAQSDQPIGRLLMVTIGLLLTYLLMALLWEIFVPIGRQLGRLMADHPQPIRAYSINVLGSLIGTWLFVAVSAQQLSPFVWFAVFALLCVFLLHTVGLSSKELLTGGGLATAVVLFSFMAGSNAGTIETKWSPYQKLALFEAPDTHVGDLQISVNNSSYQAMIDLSDSTTVADPERFPPEMQGLSQYDIPAKLHPSPRKMLIVGAGSGNDVAGALRSNPEAEITAVEIDPVIVSMGQRYHPERPYDHDRVNVVVDDARSYFARSDERFDLICFGLLDSHTTSSITNARLDHFVYTVESLRSARRLLRDGGVMVLSFEAAKPYIADRMASAIQEVFGQEPLAFRVPPSSYGWGGVFFVAGDQSAVGEQLANNKRLAGLIKQWQTEYPLTLNGQSRVATDNWPYIYLENNRIPLLYFFLAGMLTLLFVRGCVRLNVKSHLPQWQRQDWHFFFLGAAFMLLEVHGISKACVVLGSTWWVNAAVISGVLSMVLLANVISERLPGFSGRTVYVLLFAACGIIYTIDLSSLAVVSYPVRVTLVSALTTLPLLFSGILFARSFAVTPRRDLALGANLFGALVGAMLQSLSFVTGLQSLVVIVAGLYACAMVTESSRQGASAEASEHKSPRGELSPAGLEVAEATA